jgi:hypothetical protein
MNYERLKIRMNGRQHAVIIDGNSHDPVVGIFSDGLEPKPVSRVDEGNAVQPSRHSSLLFVFLASGYSAKAHAQAAQPPTMSPTPSPPPVVPSTPSEPVVVPAPASQLITGVIRDSSTGKPISGATIVVESAAATTARSDDNGGFALSAPIGPKFALLPAVTRGLQRIKTSTSTKRWSLRVPRK